MGSIPGLVYLTIITVPTAAKLQDVFIQNTSKSYSYHHKILRLLWIGNGAVLKSSSQWQLRQF